MSLCLSPSFPLPCNRADESSILTRFLKAEWKVSIRLFTLKNKLCPDPYGDHSQSTIFSNPLFSFLLWHINYKFRMITQFYPFFSNTLSILFLHFLQSHHPCPLLSSAVSISFLCWPHAILLGTNAGQESTHCHPVQHASPWSTSKNHCFSLCLEICSCEHPSWASSYIPVWTSLL